MSLTDIMIPTGVARSGMAVGDVFNECALRNVPGIPFCDAADRVVGRVSIRHTLKLTCLPDHMVKGAHLLGDAIDALLIEDRQIQELLDLPVDRFVLQNSAVISPAAPMVKALSVMEHFNSGYIFVLDRHRYQGVVTRIGIVRLLLRQRKPDGRPAPP